MENTIESAADSVSTGAAPTLLAQLGGDAALNALVGAFYFKVLLDRRLARFFADTDVAVVLDHQRMFLTAVLGGEDRYRGRSLRDAHRDLVERAGLNDGHFDAIVELLSATLVQFGYSGELVQAVGLRVLELRNDVLGRR